MQDECLCNAMVFVLSFQRVCVNISLKYERLHEKCAFLECYFANGWIDGAH